MVQGANRITHQFGLEQHRHSEAADTMVPNVPDALADAGIKDLDEYTADRTSHMADIEPLVAALF
jgi:hypothetical protein